MTTLRSRWLGIPDSLSTLCFLLAAFPFTSFSPFLRSFSSFSFSSPSSPALHSRYMDTMVYLAVLTKSSFGSKLEIYRILIDQSNPANITAVYDLITAMTLGGYCLDLHGAVAPSSSGFSTVFSLSIPEEGRYVKKYLWLNGTAVVGHLNDFKDNCILAKNFSTVMGAMFSHFNGSNPSAGLLYAAVNNYYEGTNETASEFYFTGTHLLRFPPLLPSSSLPSSHHLLLLYMCSFLSSSLHSPTNSLCYLVRVHVGREADVLLQHDRQHKCLQVLRLLSSCQLHLPL